MKREAFKMYLKPGCEAEYERRHAAIWPEMKALLAKNGVFDYSIYWDKETNILFAFQKTEGEEDGRRSRFARLGQPRDCAEVVGLYGRHHGSQPRQLSGLHSAERSVPHGLRKPA